jgi:Permeases of the drug/metabolite transporter (DMT) superfamily
MLKIDRRSLLSGIILGVLLYIGQTFQTVGLKYTTAGKQSFLIASYTIVVPFISWLLTKNKPDIYSVLSGFLTLIGIGFISLQQNLSIGYGDSLTLMFAIVFAFQIVVIGIYARNIDPIHLTTIQLLTAGTLTLISALLFEPNIEFINHQSIIGISYLVIFNTTIAFLVQNIAQKYTSDTHTSIIISLESVFGCFLAILIMGEVFTKKMIIGCILIFLAVILSKVKDKKFNFDY